MKIFHCSIGSQLFVYILTGSSASQFFPISAVNNESSSIGKLSNLSQFGSQNTTLTSITEYELPLDISWEFPRDQICLEKVIGEGAFGKVSIDRISRQNLN